MNLHQDIKQSIHEHFDFLHELGFPEFQEKQLAYEIHFYTKREAITIDICYEQIHSTPIWITINGIHATLLDEENKIIQSIYTKCDELYNANFKKYLKTDDKELLITNQELYQRIGKQLNQDFITEVSNILQRNQHNLLDDGTELKKIQTEREEILKIEKTNFAKANEIFTCEYNWSGLICEHEGTLKEIE